ncbi:MAG: UDP-N-acetylmuramoyl-L-alanyl-D-glutamate--2,6-diaminopimelate ligase [Bdellovibrionota bacterium]|jgi:UDP-N-acetylmuramoyl-L-alanyl-D-glutamate--2,6-diaminopimelate ligase
MACYSIKQLAEILGGEVCGDALTTVGAELTCDSREKLESGIFVAIRGSKVDGHTCIDEAVTNGAVIAVVERAEALNGKNGIVVSSSRKAFSRLSAFLNGDPTKKMKVVGVTGTNGKTTIQWLIYNILRELGHSALRIGTLGFEGPCMYSKESLTTPDALSLQRYFKKAYDNGAKFGVIEVSSHALDQDRVSDVAFDSGIFTNLTHDHLDYHKTMQEYYLAKRTLFELIAKNNKGLKSAIVNYDDPYGIKILQYCEEIGVQPISFGQSQGASWRIMNFSQDINGSSFSLDINGKLHKIKTPMIGVHNAYNVAAALQGCVSVGIDVEDAIRVLPQIKPVPGRLEPVGKNGIGVYVDYAHTPDALLHALKSVRDLPHRTVWVIFGCGGDRDRTKRPEMALVAARYADKVMITSDNPRSEDPEKIIADILSEGARADFIEVCRAKAIRSVMEKAVVGDVVLIAGKGHEDYQIIGTTKTHFSDQEEVEKFWEGV